MYIELFKQSLTVYHRKMQTPMVTVPNAYSYATELY